MSNYNIMTSKEIRKQFLEFFASKNHQIVPSAPMVVKGDPTLMFTNAGMNQFKEWFLGNSPIKYPRVADSQKCLRVSGKHNDLEEVGHDSYHHTMFEMLGNWSFGDYFKKEAIEWAWELLTEIYKLNPADLYATVFEGSEEDGVGMDTEAREIWRKILPEDHIILGNKHDNFWEMGDTGPCGPCSEIHIDLRSAAEKAAKPGRELVNTGHHLVIEIWNLVFMQFNRKANGALDPLPLKHVDTGMGFERLVMAINHNESNYQGDMFTPLLDKICEMSGREYGKDKDVDVACRVIADHIRAISFSIADGQLPSNVKAGYVIRRILRRAVRYGYTFLGLKEPFLCRLVDTLIEIMGEQFPELPAQKELVVKVIREEEEAFLRTLDKGIRLMDQILAKSKETKVISGKDAFLLYDTYGFPIDLTELIASENGYKVDLEAFQVELGKQKDRARNASAVESGDWVEVHHCDEHIFLGYDTLNAKCLLSRYRKVTTKGKSHYQLVFDQTPFYGEMGGEVGDNGYILSADGERVDITKAIRENNLIIHQCETLPANLEGMFEAVVDESARFKVSANHTATHLLHYALRSVLGSHVEQKGSYVEPNYFRFDFSHFERMSSEQLQEVERMVNRMIRADIHREEHRDMSIHDAKDLGAMALFGEKYGDKVRVIKFGPSVELCGGCHADSTGNIGMFRIISESAVAAGVRRIEAITGESVENKIDDMIGQMTMLQQILGSHDVMTALNKMIAANAELRKVVEEADRERVSSLKASIIADGKMKNGIQLLTFRGAARADIIRQVAFELHNERTNTAFVAGFETIDSKPALVLMYTDDLVAKGFNASKDLKDAAKFIKGGGGGQPSLATAGGRDTEGIPEAVTCILEKMD